MNPMSASFDGSGSARPVLRATTELGVVDDPSLEILRTLIFGLGQGNPYLVIERTDLPDADHYAQALHRPDGSWIVEFRDGGRNRHYQADASGPGAAYRVLAGWALQLPDWQEGLTWRPVYQ